MIGLLAPLSRLLAGVPAPVVGGSSLVIYGIIAVMGVDMLGRAAPAERSNSTVIALALTAGLLPVVAPDIYRSFPSWAGTVLGSGVVAGTLTAVLLHVLFRRFGQRENQDPDTAPDTPA